MNHSMRAPSAIRLAFSLAVLAALGAAVATAAAQQWRTVRPEGAGFSASFPAPPASSSRSERDDHGRWVNESWRATVGSAVYQVNVKDYSDYDVSGVSIDQVLSLMCRVAIAAPRSQVEPLSASVPARKCRGEHGSTAHVYWRAPNLYTALVLCEDAPCDAEARDRFLRGVRLR